MSQLLAGTDISALPARILDHLPTLVSYVDASYRYQYVNRAYENWFGVSKAEIVGRHLSAVLGEVAYRQVLPYVERVFAGEHVVFERTLSYQRGGLRHVLAEYVPDRNHDGLVIGFFALIHDMSERKRMEDALRASEAEALRHAEHLASFYAFAPVGLCVIDRELRYQHVNELLATWNGMSAADHIGRYVREVVPTLASVAGATLKEILRTRKPILDREFSGETKAAPGIQGWWRESWYPIFDERGEVVAVGVIVNDVTSLKRAEMTHSRLSAIIESSGDAIYSYDFNGDVLTWNRSAETLYGFSEAEMVGHNIERVIPEELSHEPQAFFIPAIKRGETVKDYETERRRRDGSKFPALLTASPIQNGDGQAVALSIIARDISEQKQRERQVRLLMDEVNHRAKNMLAVVQGLARRTALTSPGDFVARFEQRIVALAASHDLLVNNEWRGVDLESLICAQLTPGFDLIGDRIRPAGPPLMLNASATQTLGMALHELATNASKYGALSAEHGSVELTWSIDADTFLITWAERDGPSVKVPERRGFGSTVLASVVATSLAGEVELDYRPEGLLWRFRCSSGNVLDVQASWVPRS
jgi:PAS domain S-box-containing protein